MKRNKKNVFFLTITIYKRIMSACAGKIPSKKIAIYVVLWVKLVTTTYMYCYKLN